MRGRCPPNKNYENDTTEWETATGKQAIICCFLDAEFPTIQSLNMYALTCFKTIDVFAKCAFVAERPTAPNM